YEATKKLLEDGKEIDGIFAGNDILAIGCYKALNDLGYNLYDDIKLIGYDGLEANVDYLEISSISQSTYDLVKYAVDLLVKEIKRENQTRFKDKEKKIYSRQINRCH